MSIQIGSKPRPENNAVLDLRYREDGGVDLITYWSENPISTTTLLSFLPNGRIMDTGSYGNFFNRRNGKLLIEGGA